MNEDYGPDYITLIDDNGDEFELEVVGSMDYNRNTYMAFLPPDIDTMSEDDPNYGFVLLRVVEGPDGVDQYESIDDEDELQDVYERFMVLLYEDEEEDEEDE